MRHNKVGDATVAGSVIPARNVTTGNASPTHVLSGGVGVLAVAMPLSR